jgi:hypothetical protein
VAEAEKFLRRYVRDAVQRVQDVAAVLDDGDPVLSGGDDAGEVGAAEEVLVLTGRCVGDGGARRLGLGDPFVELGKLALGEFPPGVEAIGTSGDQRL